MKKRIFLGVRIIFCWHLISLRFLHFQFTVANFCYVPLLLTKVALGIFKSAFCGFVLCTTVVIDRRSGFPLRLTWDSANMCLGVHSLHRVDGLGSRGFVQISSFFFCCLCSLSNFEKLFQSLSQTWLKACTEDGDLCIHRQGNHGAYPLGFLQIHNVWIICVTEICLSFPQVSQSRRES